MKKLFFKKDNKRIGAFTLLETLTSIAILSLVIVGPLTVIIGSSSYARQTKDVMVATYLGEETIELMQNQYDSIYLFCKNQATDTMCVSPTEETTGQASWRVFKERFAAIDGYPSCYTADNSYGCSFDYLDLIGSPTTTPSRYAANSAYCPFLVSVVEHVPGEEDRDPVDLHTYACSGVPGHITGSTTQTTFTRKVFIEQVPTFEGGLPTEEQYNDDLRVTSEIQFKGVNGVTQTQKIIRFFHARP